jgi:hypothetical protein
MQKYAIVPIMARDETHTSVAGVFHAKPGYHLARTFTGKLTRDQVEKMAANHYIRSGGIREILWDDLTKNQQSIYMRRMVAAVESIGLEVEYGA